MVDTCHLSIPKAKSDSKYGLLLMIMYKYWLINCYKGNTPMQDVDVGRNWGSGSMREDMGTL